MLEIVTFVLGPVQTNAYLIADAASGDAAVIDPAWDGDLILQEARRRGWRISHLWYTHAHFDHIGGAGAIADGLNPLPLVALHPADHALWRMEVARMPSASRSIPARSRPSIYIRANCFAWAPSSCMCTIRPVIRRGTVSFMPLRLPCAFAGT